MILCLIGPGSILRRSIFFTASFEPHSQKNTKTSIPVLRTISGPISSTVTDPEYVHDRHEGTEAF